MEKEKTTDNLQTKLLEQIESPSDLKKLSVESLPCLAEEVREKIIETVSQTGGHVSPYLGVVELTIFRGGHYRHRPALVMQLHARCSRSWASSGIQVGQ